MRSGVMSALSKYRCLVAADDAQALDNFRQAGVHRTLIGLPSENRDTVLPILDKLATHIQLT